MDCIVNAVCSSVNVITVLNYRNRMLIMEALSINADFVVTVVCFILKNNLMNVSVLPNADVYWNTICTI